MNSLSFSAVTGPMLDQAHVGRRSNATATWNAIANRRQILFQPDELISRQLDGIGRAGLGRPHQDVVLLTGSHDEFVPAGPKNSRNNQEPRSPRCEIARTICCTQLAMFPSATSMAWTDRKNGFNLPPGSTTGIITGGSAMLYRV